MSEKVEITNVDIILDELLEAVKNEGRLEDPIVITGALIQLILAKVEMPEASKLGILDAIKFQLNMNVFAHGFIEDINEEFGE